MRFLVGKYDPTCAAAAIGSIAGPAAMPVSLSGGRVRAPVILYLPCLIINYLRF
jgi:hypothetical protein